MSIRVSAAFEAGAIEVVDCTDPADIQLAIRQDSAADFRQWFYFRLDGQTGQQVTLRLINAGDCTYAYGWDGYRVVSSFDRLHWERVADTQYGDGELRCTLTLAHDSVWLAYFEPYSYERHQDLIARLQTLSAVRTRVLGYSVEGRPIEVVILGEESAGRLPLWVVARQHPGETMAEWCAEGLIERALQDDALCRQLLQQAVLYVVPNINPDGACHGNLRTNAAGANLNREWLAPTAERSPEVLAVRQAMEQSGVAGFLDLHGDETIPQVFVDGNGMLPGWTAAQVACEQAFIENLLHLSPDFQTEAGYAADRFSDEMLTLASKYVAHRFGCLSLTVEMPFKDHDNNPQPATGWNGARSKRLGAHLLEALALHVVRLTGDSV